MFTGNLLHFTSQNIRVWCVGLQKSRPITNRKCGNKNMQQNGIGIKKQDRSRRCQYIQSIDTFLKKSFYFILFFFLRKKLSNRQNIIKFVIYGSELVEIDTLLAKFTRNSKICFFGGHFVISS